MSHSLVHRGIRISIATAVAITLFAGSVAPVLAQTGSRKAPSDDAGGPQRYQSRNFVVFTDLPDADAEDLLKRLETMLQLISKYWARPNRQTIEMYVVKDLEVWPQSQLHPDGLISIREGGGLTISRVMSQGNRFSAKSVVYAIADRGTPQHEAVHAYCAQTFGRTGPVWYAEGMAEMGQYWQGDDSAVHCHQHVVDYLKSEEPKDLLDLVSPDQVTGDSWQNYAWRWALCHLLANNPNYADRFRPLGLGLLTGQKVSFEQVYGPMAKEITFEYEFFLKHFDIGYRADLCGWDWKTKSSVPRGAKTLVSKIKANAGWQPSRVRVVAGEDYNYSGVGNWTLDEDNTETNADGIGEPPRGRLIAAIFDDDTYELSEPLDLGAYGTFKAPAGGNLVLRCGEEWHKLADNDGLITVRVKRDDPDRPLPMPESAR